MSGLLTPVWPRGPRSASHKGFLSSGGSVGGLTNSNPVGLTREVAHKIFYRTRKIQYRLYLEIEVDGAGGTRVPGIYDLDTIFSVGGTYSIVGTSVTPTGAGAFTSENQLVSYPTGLGWCRSTGNDIDFMRDDVARNRASGGLYWPQFRATKGAAGLAAGYFTGRPSSVNPASQLIEWDFTGTFFGEDIPVRAFYNSLTVDPVFILGIFIFDFTTGTDCYWAYNPGDGGGDIWDTTDGDQLRFDIPGLV